jgi:hypothetical protein
MADGPPAKKAARVRRLNESIVFEKYRGRIALSPSQPGLNPRSSRDNRSYNCFFKPGRDLFVIDHAAGSGNDCATIG